MKGRGYVYSPTIAEAADGLVSIKINITWSVLSVGHFQKVLALSKIRHEGEYHRGGVGSSANRRSARVAEWGTLLRC